MAAACSKQTTSPFITGTMSAVLIDISDRIATITLNRPASLNAITRDGTWRQDNYVEPSLKEEWLTDYDAFANGLREIDKREDVVVTVWQGASRDLGNAG